MVEEKKDSKGNNIHDNSHLNDSFSNANEGTPLRRLTLKKLDDRSFDSTVKDIYGVDERIKEFDSFVSASKGSTTDDLKAFSPEDSGNFSGRDSGGVIGNVSKGLLNEDVVDNVGVDSNNFTYKNLKKDIFFKKENSTDLANSLLDRESVRLDSFPKDEISLFVAKEVDQVKAEAKNIKDGGATSNSVRHGNVSVSKIGGAKEEYVKELSHVSKSLNATTLEKVQRSLHSNFKGLGSSNNLRSTLDDKKDFLQESKAQTWDSLRSKQQESDLQEGFLSVKNQEIGTLKEENSNKSSSFVGSNVTSSIKGEESYDSTKYDKFYENEKFLDEEFLSSGQLNDDLGEAKTSKVLQQQETSNNEDQSEINRLKTSVKVVADDNTKPESFNVAENFRASFSKELKENTEDGFLQNIVPNVYIENIKEEEPVENSWKSKESERLLRQENAVKIETVKSMESFNSTANVDKEIGQDSTFKSFVEDSPAIAEDTKTVFVRTKVETQPKEGDIVQQAVVGDKPKSLLGRIIPKKIAVTKKDKKTEQFSQNKTIKELDVSKYSEKEIASINKIDKVLDSVALLFKPFKEILRKTLPFLNPVLNALDKFGLSIATIVRFIAYKSPMVIRFIKGRIFKAIVIVVIFGFLLGILASRLINSKEYITALENAIYDKTGYKIAINGVIKVNIIPSFGIGIKNVVVLKNQNFESDFALSQLSAEQINITFKILPILFGNFEIDKIYLHQAVIDINIKNSTNNNSILSYENTIKNINRVTAFKVVKKTENTHTENLKGSLLQQLDNIIGSKEQAVEDNSDLLNDIVIGENSSDANKSSVGEDNTTKQTNDSENLGDISSSDKVDLNPNPNPNPNQEGSGGENNNANQVATLNNVIDTNIVENKGAIYALFSGIVKNISFDLPSVDQIRVARSKVNIFVGKNRISSLDNVEGTIKTSFLNETTSQGSFRFMDINTYYSLDLDYLKRKQGVNFDFKLGTDTSLNNALEVIGKKLKNGNITADVMSNGQIDLLLINKFIIPMDFTQEENHSFKAKLEITPNTVHLKDINLLFPSVEYSGDLLWNLSNNYSNNALLNLKARVKSLEDYINSYTKFVKDNSSEHMLKFSSVLDSISNWKNESINNFKFNYFKVNFDIEESKLNSQNVGLKLEAILNEDKIFVENLLAKGETFYFNAIGKVSLDEKNAMFILESAGDIEKTASFFKLPTPTKKFLLNLGSDKEEVKDYSLATKLVINNNKFVFNEFKGYLGEKYFYDTYLVFLERSGNMDLLINDRIDNLNADYLSEIYRKQIEGTSNIEDSGINLFGFGKDFNININLVANTFNYKDIVLKNALIDMVLSESGVRVKKFEANGKYGGSVVASFIADINVMPVVAGHLNLNNFVLKMEETDKFIFNGKNIIGDLYLNGQFRFSGDSYIKPFSNLEGQLTFVKYERIKLNRFANTDGLYMTLSEKKQGNKTYYLLNDAYGRLNIKEGVVNFYPVVMLYIYGNKEYRGTFEGSYDFINDGLKVQGSVDNADNINNQMNFKVEGSLLNPSYNRKFAKLTRSNVAVRQKAQVTTLDTKSYTIANKLNNNQDKNNFNNIYNKNVDKDERYIIDNIYNDALSRSLNSTKNEDSFSSQYPIKK